MPNNMRKVYSCGPTVYNRSHIGHARTMIMSDIMIRVAERTETVISAMNITDIDDKIVNQCFKKHLSGIVRKMIDSYGLAKIVQKWVTETYPDMFNKALDATDIIDIYNWLLSQDIEKMTENDLQINYDQYIDFVRDLEQKFWDDMDKINVRRPIHIIRVSDNIEHIIEYIQKIIDNGFAYVSNGSVYFDSKKFIEAGFNFHPLKKETSCDIPIKSITNEKKATEDFVLWKAKKRLDICFPSPWGYGRPGWHIECSCMINQLFGDSIDTHCGGDDLIFPHHNNEYIQTVAYYNGVKGVPANYFHTHRLLINNEKMSQSRDNFLTINDALKSLTGRQLRLLLISVSPHRSMNFSQDQYEQIIGIDKKIQRTIESLDRKISEKYQVFKITDEDLIKFNTYRESIESELLNLETGKLISLLEDICTQISLFDIDDHRFLRKYYKLLTSTTDILGLDYTIKQTDSISEQLLDTVCDIRDTLRNIAKQDKINKQDIYQLSDWIRDNRIKKLCLSIEDRNDRQRDIFHI